MLSRADAAASVLATRPDVSIVYCHTTDYPMHMSPPEGELSQIHLSKLDDRLGSILDAFPDLAVYVTADHGMNTKRRCYDLGRALAAAASPSSSRCRPSAIHTSGTTGRSGA